LLGAVPLLVACGAKTTQIDPTAYQITSADRIRVEIPDACRIAYENAVPKIAVVDFANNTTFDLAEVVQAHAKGSYARQEVHGGVWGVTAGPGGIGVGNAKLGESIAEAVVSELANIGGMKIYTRKDLQKVLEEQKFQMSGLVDPNTAVQIGQLAGVRYIVTGAVNNINLKWVEVGESVKRGLSQQLGLVGTVLAAGVSTQEGWNLSVDIVLKDRIGQGGPRQDPHLQHRLHNRGSKESRTGSP